MNISYILNSGKNSKMRYFVVEIFHYMLPGCLFRHRLGKLLECVEKRDDSDYIKKRVDYYNKMNATISLPCEADSIAQHKKRNWHAPTVYLLDSHHYLTYFDQHLRFLIKPGDVRDVPQCPSLVKSRPASNDNQNSILLNMDKVRHFLFVKDKIPFAEKKTEILFRGETDGKPWRQMFLKMYFSHPMCDVGEVSDKNKLLSAFLKQKLTISQSLRYKFIMCLEGNDVASNLKWVMSSNSIAVMPRPRFETWFMEGTLIPNYHYIEICPDFSDLIERCQHYIDHPAEAEAIIQHAHDYVRQFFDRRREKIISLLVLDKYFRMTKQIQ